MTTVIRLVAAAAVSIAASLPALAEETKAASDAPPIPTLHCEFKLSTPALATALARPGRTSPACRSHSRQQKIGVALQPGINLGPAKGPGFLLCVAWFSGVLLSVAF